MTQTSKRSGGRETATQTECRHLFMMLDALFSPREDDSSRLFQSLRELQALPRELYGSSMVESFRRQVGRKLKGSYGGSSNASMDCRLRFDLCCQAVNDVQLTLLLGRLTTDRDFLATPMGCAMAQVVALFRNSEAVFRELQQVEPVSAFASYARMAFVRCCWFTQEWFHSRSQYLQAVLLGDMVRSFGTEGAVHPVLVRALDDFARGRIQILGATADMLALAAFWQGAPARALALTEKPAHDLVGEGPRRMARALVSVFRGETGQALEDCREAVKALKKQMRVRGQLTIGQAPGLVLNLVRFLSGEEAELKEMRRVLPKLTQPALNSGDASIFGIPGFHGLAALDALRQGEAEHAGRIVSAVFHHGMRDDNCLSNLIFYAACARIDTDLPVGAAVRDWFRRCEGLPLLQRAFADILAEIPEEGGAGKWGRAGANQEPKLNVMQMVERMEDWQRSLYALETLANESGDAKKEKRLVWVLDPDNDDVEVLQQTLGQHGWSKGRALSLKNLDERAAGLNWLSEDERRIISYIEAGDWWNAQSVLRLSACCDALEGRDLLFMRARDGSGALVPVTLKRGRLEFRLEETGKGSYVLSFGAIDTEFGARAGYLFTCEDGVITYYKFDERERRALSLVGEGLKVPASELPRVLNLTRSNLNIAMRTDSVSAEDVEPVNSPVIQLEQTASGFAGTLGVRPFGRPDTMFFPTGEGALEPLASVPVEGDGPDGTSLGLARTLRVRRDFAAENEALAGLMNDCPTLAQGLEDRHWSTGDIEDVLGLLEELRASAVPNSVEWPRGHRLRLRGRLEAKDVKVRIGWSKSDWFDIEGGAQLDEDRFLSLSSMLSMLKGSRFVSLGDGEYVALTDDLRRRLSSLKLVGVEGKKDGLQINALASSAVENALDGMELEADEKWEFSVDRMHRAFETQPQVPSLLQADLREYQREGYEWMQRLAIWGVGACLADDMGLGKTLQSIAVMINQAAAGPCLVVAPTSVCGNWESEIARFAPSLATHRLGHAKRAEAVKALGPGDVLVVGYGLLPNIQAELSSRTWSMIVFDEAQALKNAATKRAKVCRKLAADFRLALTGTPIENRIDDLWSLFNIINPGLLGSWDSFVKRYGQAAPGSSASRSLRAVVRPFLLRRLKSAVLDELPEKTEQNILVEPNEKELAFYEALRRRAVEKVTGEDAAGDGSRRFEILAELTRLRRACCHPGLADPDMMAMEKYSSKTEQFLDMAESLVQGGHKVLAFSQFTSYLAMLRDALDERGIKWQYLDGQTPEKDRRERVAAFQRGQGDVFLLSLKAGGTGINLTAADYVIHLDPWWNPAVEDQASDRAHRIGQKRPVTIYRMVQKGSVEEKILTLHATKRELAAEFLEGTETGVKKLSEEDLLNLMR